MTFLLSLALACALAPAPVGARVGAGQAASPCGPAAPAADLSFTLRDMHEREIRLDAFRGRVLLLYFWATWCLECRSEMLAFEDLQRRYGARGLHVLAVSIDDPPRALIAYARRLNLTYPLVQGRGRDDLKRAYGPMWGVPITFIVDRNGRICKKLLGPASLDTLEKAVRAVL